MDEERHDLGAQAKLDFGEGYRDGFGPKRSRRAGSRLWSYAVVALVASIIGGLVVAVALPRLAGQGAPSAPAPAPREVSPQPVPSGGNNLPVSQVSGVAESVGPAVVGVVNKMVMRDIFGRAVMSQGTGSGVIFDAANGYIVTNNHVVEDARELVVSLADGRKVPARIIGLDAIADLAVIKVDATGLTAARLGDSDKVRVGDLAVAIGNPLGLDFERTVTAGIISGLNRLLQVSEENSMRLIQTDATINPGNSGGPLVNAAGEVIGINTIKFSDAQRGVEGMGFAIPSNTVRAIVDDLVRYGYVKNRPYLGVGAVDRQEAALYYSITIERGLLIVSVAPGSPADAVGLRVGDNLVGLDGKAVQTVADLRTILFTKKPGDLVAVSYRRGSAEKSLEVTLARTPAKR